MAIRLLLRPIPAQGQNFRRTQPPANRSPRLSRKTVVAPDGDGVFQPASAGEAATARRLRAVWINSASPQSATRQITIETVPTVSCHFSMADLFSQKLVRIIDTDKVHHEGHAASEANQQRRLFATNSSIKFTQKQGDIIKAVCNDRIPLQASSTLTHQSADLNQIALGHRRRPQHESRNSALTAALNLIRFCDRESSHPTGHGRAVKQNNKGKAKSDWA